MSCDQDVKTGIFVPCKSDEDEDEDDDDDDDEDDTDDEDDDDSFRFVHCTRETVVFAMLASAKESTSYTNCNKKSDVQSY